MLVFCTIHTIEVDCYSNVHLYASVNNYIWMYMFYIYILSFVFVLLCIAHFIEKNLSYLGFLEYVSNARDSWYLVKGAPLGF